jgi:hypothetical protein
MSATSSSGRQRPLRARHRVAQRRVRIDLEHVERRVIRADGDQRVDRLEPLGTVCCGSHIMRSSERLSKPAARASAPRRRPGSRSGAGEAAQFVVAERLHAEAETVDTGCAKPVRRSTVPPSGLASSVISASAVRSNDSRQA